jgi:hypothetical protein
VFEGQRRVSCEQQAVNFGSVTQDPEEERFRELCQVTARVRDSRLSWECLQALADQAAEAFAACARNSGDGEGRSAQAVMGRMHASSKGTRDGRFGLR